jgi:hypothetical protein
MRSLLALSLVGVIFQVIPALPQTPSPIPDPNDAESINSNRGNLGLLNQTIPTGHQQPAGQSKAAWTDSEGAWKVNENGSTCIALPTKPRFDQGAMPCYSSY